MRYQYFLIIFFSEVIRIFVFSGMLRYNVLKTYSMFTFDNIYRSPTYIEFILLSIFYEARQYADIFITLDGKLLI